MHLAADACRCPARRAVLGASRACSSTANGARWIALVATLIDLALGIVLWASTDSAAPQWQFPSVGAVRAGFAWALGIDGIALMLIVLSRVPDADLHPRQLDSITKRVPEYMAAFLLMETLMIGVFAAQDLFLFYIFFEAGLIPMYLIIGIWGGADRIYAALQILPLHAARLGADAGRDAVDGASTPARPTSRR